MTSVSSGQPPPFSSDSPLPPPTSVPGPIPEATQGTSFTSNDNSSNGGGKKRRTLLIVGIALAVLVLGAVSIITALRLQEIGPEPVAPTAPLPAPAAEPVAVESRCGTGTFTTSGGHVYCFLVNGDIKTREQARTACQPHGGLAIFLDGETKQDVLDVISRFNQDKSALYQHTSGDNENDGAYFADNCNEFKEHFGEHDSSLYRGSEGGDSINCSERPLSLSRSHNGRINDTKDGNGRGAVCERDALASPSPSPSPSPSLSPSASPAASPSPSASPTATACQGSCTVDTDCEGALICSSGSCVNSLCPNDGDCTCDLGGASPTPTPTPTPSAAPRVSQPTSGDNLPEAGLSGPTIGLFGAGVVTVILGILVLLL